LTKIDIFLNYYVEVNCYSTVVVLSFYSLVDRKEKGQGFTPEKDRDPEEVETRKIILRE